MPSAKLSDVVKPKRDLSGRILRGNLELTSLLGSGAMGQVYLARHLNLDKQVAIKVIRADPPPTERQVARFRTEAKATSKLEHQNCIQLLDFGEEAQDGLLFLVMEMLDGDELTKLLSREHILVDQRCARIMLQVLAALASAHDLGIVHRDVKPGNIMLVQRMGDDGLIPEFVKVCDFGIAKLIRGGENEEPLTLEGTSLGTPAFAAPEQLMGMDVDGRADIYACGILMYRMLTGRLPFTGEPMEVAMAQVSAQAKPVVEHRPGLDPRLIAVIEKAMQKRPDDRFQTARQMRNAIKPILGIPTHVPTGEFFPLTATSSAPPPPFGGPATPSSAPPGPAISSAPPPPPFGGPATPSSAPPGSAISSAPPPPPFGGPATPSSVPPGPAISSAPPPPPFGGPATPSSVPPGPAISSAPPPPPFGGPATPSSTPPRPAASSAPPPPPFGGPSPAPPMFGASEAAFVGAPSTPPVQRTAPIARAGLYGAAAEPLQASGRAHLNAEAPPHGASSSVATGGISYIEAPTTGASAGAEPMMDLEFDEPEPYVP